MMNTLDRESLLIGLETKIDKAEHVAAKIIREYGFDLAVTSEEEDMIFCGNRANIGIELDILMDYIKTIRAGAQELEAAIDA